VRNKELDGLIYLICVDRNPSRNWYSQIQLIRYAQLAINNEGEWFLTATGAVNNSSLPRIMWEARKAFLILDKRSGQLPTSWWEMIQWLRGRYSEEAIRVSKWIMLFWWGSSVYFITTTWYSCLSSSTISKSALATLNFCSGYIMLWHCWSSTRALTVSASWAFTTSKSSIM